MSPRSPPLNQDDAKALLAYVNSNIQKAVTPLKDEIAALKLEVHKLKGGE
jgi:hypothetical protein